MAEGSRVEARSEKPAAKTFRQDTRSLNSTQWEAILFIEYKCSGGYGGLRLSYQCETDAMPTDESKPILDLIDAARVLKLDPKQISTESRRIPDDFACLLTIISKKDRQTLSFNELSAPENLRRLSAYLRMLAIKQQGRH